MSSSIRRSVLLFVVAALAVARIGFGQGTDDQFSLTGSVVNAQTGEPVKRALVHITGYGVKNIASGAEGAKRMAPGLRVRPPVNMTAFTDAGGVFRFQGLFEAFCIFSVQKPGFSPLAAGSPEAQLRLTGSLDNVKLSVSPLGVITGHITDQDDQPLRLIDVLVLTAEVQDGKRQTKQERSVVTDDLGVYRMWNFTPGKYYVKAAGQGGGTFVYTGDTVPRLSSGDTFGPAYFGGGDSLASATPIQIQPGSELTADISLRSQPAHKVRGQLTNFIPHGTVRFELASGDEDTAPSRVSVNGDTGRFEIQDVVAGAYTLRAIQGNTQGEVSVSVNSSDVAGLVVTLLPGTDIAVNTRFINGPAVLPERDAGIRQDGGVPGACSVSLRPAGRRSGTTYRNIPGPKDQSLTGVFPGTYRVSVECFGVYPRSVLSGTLDLLANPVVTVEPASQPAPIDILAAFGGGRIAGKLDSKASLQPGDGMILLVPLSGGEPKRVSLFRQAGATEPYQFRFDSLAPGPYAAWAFTDSRMVEYRNLDWLRALPGGTSVQVDENAEATLTLKDFVK